MDTAKDTDRDQFTEAKDAFSELELEQKAIFLVSQAADTVVEAVSTLAEYVAEECNSLFDTSNKAEKDETESSEEASS